MSHISALVLSISVLTSASMANAEYQGPVQNELNRIDQIIDNGKDDQMVRLQGYLIEKVSNDKYLFSDGQQQIRVEIDDHLFPAEPFDHQDRIEILGEVEKDYLESAEIDVDSLRLLR